MNRIANYIKTSDTLSRLESDADYSMERIKKGIGTEKDLKIVQIYLSQFNKKNPRGGKRKQEKTGR